MSYPREIRLLPPSVQVSFLSWSGLTIEGYLGNKGHNNPLPVGFAIKEHVLAKPPWLFGEMLLLKVNDYSLRDKLNKIIRIYLEASESLLCKALKHEGVYYCYLVVRKPINNRVPFEPIVIREPLLTA